MVEFLSGIATFLGMGVTGVYLLAGVLGLGIIIGGSVAGWRIYRHFKPKPLKEGLLTKTRNLIREKQNKEPVNKVARFKLIEKIKDKFGKWLGQHKDNVNPSKQPDAGIGAKEKDEQKVSFADKFKEKVGGLSGKVKGAFTKDPKKDVLDDDMDLRKSNANKEDEVVQPVKELEKALNEETPEIDETLFGDIDPKLLKGEEQQEETKDDVIYLGPATSHQLPPAEAKAETAKAEAEYGVGFNNDTEEVEKTEVAKEVEEEKTM